jgi:hypothetical protein
MPGKHEQEQIDEENEAAIEILIGVGLFKRCEVDRDPLDVSGLQDATAAYQQGNALITRQDPVVAVFGGDRRAMTDAVKRVFDDAQYLTCTHQSYIDQQP